MTTASNLTLFLGHFHPLLVHLPIGLIVLLVFLELLARSARFAHAKAAVGPVLLLAVPTSIASVICGWLLAGGGGYDDRLLQLHRWSGLVVAVLCTLAGLAHWLGLKRLYGFGLGLCFFVLVGASHVGASLTHGRDYLTRYAPAPLRARLGGEATQPAAAPTALAEKQAFAHVVKTVLDNYCVSCHGPERAKAGLRLDSLEAVLKGGDNGPVIVAGKPAESILIQRTTLPPDDDDHMPPVGKPQPGKDDLALLTWWVSAGATDRKIGELKPPANIQQLLESRFANPPVASHSTPSDP